MERSLPSNEETRGRKCRREKRYAAFLAPFLARDCRTTISVEPRRSKMSPSRFDGCDNTQETHTHAHDPLPPRHRADGKKVYAREAGAVIVMAGRILASVGLCLFLAVSTGGQQTTPAPTATTVQPTTSGFITATPTEEGSRPSPAPGRMNLSAVGAT